MNKFNILICEDSDRDFNLIDGYLKSLKSTHTDLNITWQQTKFLHIFDVIQKETFDLLILDMYEGKTKNMGTDVLEFINNISNKTTTIIYTGAGNRDTDFYDLKEKYNFLIDFIVKGEQGRTLKKAIEKNLFKNKDRLFDLYDNDDVLLRAEIRSIGEQNLNEILFKIKSESPSDSKFILERMSSGFSGAAIFKLIFNGRSSILKISREKEKLRGEFVKALNFYKKFPDHLIIEIQSKEYLNDEVIAILMNEVSNSQTLFDWICKCNDEEKINKFFKKLFLSEGSLKDHYRNNMSINEEHKFSFIFNNFDDTKISIISSSLKGLGPLLVNLKYKFNFSKLKNLVENQSFSEINKNSLLGDKFIKKIVLCHGDFHSNNILIKGGRPVLIDAGGMGYNYWCTDICRLIVHLFITGFDINTKDFFDVNQIEKNVKIAIQFIELKKMDLDGINDGFIHAINWLVNNAQEIYGDQFSPWEFQLGLMKEFLILSYRINSVPPNKRVIALLGAYQCMLKANKNLKKLIAPRK